MRSFPIFTALSLLVASILATSPVAAETITLGMEDAVRTVLDRHPALAASERGVEGAEAVASQTRTGWLPRVTVEAGYQYAGPLPELSMDPGIANPITGDPILIEQSLGTEHNAKFGLQVGWRAWDFGARDRRTDAALAGVDAALAQGRERAVDIALAVRNAYLASQFFSAVEDVTLRSLATNEQELSEEKLRREAGIGDDVAVARVESRVAELEARLEATHQGRARALATLRILLGFAPDRSFELSEALPEIPPDFEAPASARHSGLARLDALQEVTVQQRKSLWSAYWPTIDLFGGVYYQHPKSFVEDKWGPAYMAGVSLKWEVFDGDLKRRQRRELEAKEAQVGELQRAFEEELNRGTAEALSDLRSAAASAVAARRTLAAAEVYLRAARGAVDAGTGTALDLRKAEEATDRARLALVQARFDGARAHTKLLHSAGIATLAAGEARGPR